MLDVLRKEIKYTISPYTERILATRLGSVMDKDVHNNDRGYMVRSLYFDTMDNQDFFDKSDGIEFRKKIRLRIYDVNSNFAKLELKEKQNTVQRKRSLLVDRQEAEALISGDYQCLWEKGDFGKELYTKMMSEHYHPVCVVQYQRQAFICKTNDIRITLDRQLMSNEGNYNLFDENMQLYPVDLSGSVTLEVKYNHFLLSYIKDIISITDKISTSSSKYCRSRIFGLKGE